MGNNNKKLHSQMRETRKEMYKKQNISHIFKIDTITNRNCSNKGHQTNWSNWKTAKAFITGI